MRTIENNKITSKLFREDIRNKKNIKNFERIFEIKIADFLSEYDYDEIDEFPIEIKNRGIMIGFMAATIKVPPQIEYIDFDICNYPENISFLNKSIPLNSDFSESKKIEKHLIPCSNLRIYYSLYNIKQVDRIIFQDENIRYELLINEDVAISRIRICFNENESNINMRTYYPFE